MIFYKTVSAGNDFIHVDINAIKTHQSFKNESHFKSNLARGLCDRQFGAGADGVIFYEIQANSVDFTISNNDGIEAEISGNGMAGISALLFYLNHFTDHIILNTKVGKKSIKFLNQKKNSIFLRIEIGEADFFNHSFFPFLKKDKYVYNFNSIEFFPVSVGNPHVVVLLENNPSEEELLRLGKMLENADIFPQRTNVEFVIRMRNNLKPIPNSCFLKNEKDEEFQLFYYERGVGRTLSSSTGNAAIFSVLKRLDFFKQEITIQTPFEKILISGKTKIFIENSTKIVYKGIFLS
jgi:diaminopimelate epimerase